VSLLFSLWDYLLVQKSLCRIQPPWVPAQLFAIYVDGLALVAADYSRHWGSHLFMPRIFRRCAEFSRFTGLLLAFERDAGPVLAGNADAVYRVGTHQRTIVLLIGFYGKRDAGGALQALMITAAVDSRCWWVWY
jgi:hypothetical protein